MTVPIVAESAEHVCKPPLAIDQLPATTSLRILALPDLHIPFGQGQKQLLLSKREFLDAHDWVVLLGDTIACYGTPDEYRHVNRFIEALNRPYSVTNGNHEFCFEPFLEVSDAYGRRFEDSAPAVQRQQLERFARFYGMNDRFDAGRHALGGFCLLGVDQIAPDNAGHLSEPHELWFQQALDRLAALPMIVFAHFPLQDARLDAIRYYVAGRRPYYVPSEATARALQRRTQPTFWFSGHLHFRPTHPLAEPYRTQDGVWQLHCPDGRGFGRSDNEQWHPEQYTGMAVRSIHLQPGRVTVVTTDLQQDSVLARHEFALPPLQP